jgi:hypothetical protein
MAQQVFEEWTEWTQEVAADADVEALLGKGEAMIASLVGAMTARGLPPGAVIEIEFGLRRREAAFA